MMNLNYLMTQLRLEHMVPDGGYWSVIGGDCTCRKAKAAVQAVHTGVTAESIEEKGRRGVEHFRRLFFELFQA
jgi:hypothetical protein